AGRGGGGGNEQPTAPSHAVPVDDILVDADALVNGVSIAARPLISAIQSQRGGICQHASQPPEPTCFVRFGTGDLSRQRSSPNSSGADGGFGQRQINDRSRIAPRARLAVSGGRRPAPS